MEPVTVKINDEEMEVIIGKYYHGNGLVVKLLAYDGPYATLSVNLHGHPDSNINEVGLEKDEFVLNHDLLAAGQNLYILRELLESGLFKVTQKKVNYGFCKDIPIWKYLGKIE